MLRVARFYARDEQVAAEIVQNAWISVLRGLEKFEGRSSLRTWVFTILKNSARREAKKEARSIALSAMGAAGEEERELKDFFAANHPRWASCWTTINTRWESRPESALTTREAERAITEQLRALPPRQSAVLVLRDLEGWSSEEVCSVLELSPSNQRVLLHRARLAMRRSLQEALD